MTLPLVGPPTAEEISAGSFEDLKPGDEIRLIQVTDAKITSFAPATGRPGRVCFGIVHGGPFDGTEQWQWIPSTDAEAAAMKMTVFIRHAPPTIGTLRHRPEDGSTWAATDQPGLYACVGSGSVYQVGATQWRQNLGVMEVPQ